MKGLYILAQTDLQMAKNNLALLKDVQDEVYPRTHNIAVLVDACEKLNIKIPELIEAYDVVITEWATGTRYDSSFVTSKRQLLKVIECLDIWFKQDVK